MASSHERSAGGAGAISPVASSALLQCLGTAIVDQHWRRSPVCHRGLATQMIGPLVTRDRFMAACARLNRVCPQLVHQTPDRFTFAQQLDRVDLELRRASRQVADHVRGVSVWFDGVCAEDGEGVGSHYDIADSLIMQQSGEKIWRLHPPTSIPQHELHARLLNETRVDTIDMPDEFVEYRLEPGDVLYVPMLWIHWGVSLGPSVSVSLALTSRNALQWLPSALGRVCERSGSGAGGALSMFATRPARAKIAQALWDVLYDPSDPFEDEHDGAASKSEPAGAPLRYASLRRDPAWSKPVPAIWSDEVDGGTRSADRARAHIEGLVESVPSMTAGGPATVSSHRATGIGPTRTRRAPPDSLFDIRPAPIDWAVWLDVLVTQGASEALIQLSEHVRWINTQRMLTALRRALVQSAGSSSRVWMNTCLSMTRLDHTALSSIACSPELTSFTWRLAQSLEHNYVPRVSSLSEWLEPLASYLLEPPSAEPDASVPIWFQASAHARPQVWQGWLAAFGPRGSLAAGLRCSSDRTSEATVAELRAKLASTRVPFELAKRELTGAIAREPGPVEVESLHWYRGVVWLDLDAPNTWPRVLAREVWRRVAYDLIDVAPVFEASRRPGWAFPFLEPNTQAPLADFHRWFVESTSESPVHPPFDDPALSDWGRTLVERWRDHGPRSAP